MSKRDDSTSILQMLDHAREAVELSRGRSRDDLDSNRVYFLATTRLLEIVGEAAGRVTEAFRRSHPGVPWSQIVGLRNRISHGYDEIDRDRVWEIVQADLPPLAAQLEQMLKQP